MYSRDKARAIDLVYKLYGASLAQWKAEEKRRKAEEKQQWMVVRMRWMRDAVEAHELREAVRWRQMVARAERDVWAEERASAWYARQWWKDERAWRYHLWWLEAGRPMQ